jgi:hypothetical protein
VTNQSGGQINQYTGLYTAGTACGTTTNDTIAVFDFNGVETTMTFNVACVIIQ